MLTTGASAELERAASSIVALNAENQALLARTEAQRAPATIGRLWVRLWPVVAVLVLVLVGMLLAWWR